MAIKYGIIGGGNWSGATWATASNQAVSDTTKPIAGDTAILDAYSGNITVDEASACAVVNCTGYTGTLELDADITTTGNVTLVTGMTFTPNSQKWTMSDSNVAFVPAGKTLYDFTIGTNIDVTLTTSDLNISHNLTLENESSLRGSRTITMTGTGTWSGSGVVYTNLTFNTEGIITISGIIRYGDGILTYTAGTMIVTGSSLTNFSSCSLNTSGMSWNNLWSSYTITLTSDINIDGIITPQSGTTFAGTGNVNLSGGMVVGTTITGRTITMDGTGTWSGSGVIRSNIIFDTEGTITISGIVAYASGTMTYLSGTIIVTDSTLRIREGNCSLNTSGMSWNNIAVLDGTATLTSSLNVNGTLAVTYILACGTNQVILTGNLSNLNTSKTAWRTGNNTFVFNGTSTISSNVTALGATFYNFTIEDGATVHLTSGDTYAVTGTFNAEGTIGDGIILDTTTPSSSATFPVTTLGTVSYVTATDIDSTGGVNVIDTNGTLLRTTKWYLIIPTAIKKIASVAYASIKKTSSIAIAGIKKVAGIE